LIIGISIAYSFPMRQKCTQSFIHGFAEGNCFRIANDLLGGVCTEIECGTWVLAP
jgi:hypothetical protein